MLPSYITPEEATEYILAMLPTDNPARQKWEGSTDADKKVYLANATTRIDTMRYKGKKATADQVLAFPRYGQTEVPEAVKMACALEAASTTLSLSQTSSREALQAAGVSSVSVGNASETYGGEKVTALGAFSSRLAQSLLRKYMAGVARIV